MSNLMDFLGSGTKQKIEEFTSNGTWTRPAGVDVVEVWLVGGGGGGQGGDTTANRPGGGGGQVVHRVLGVTGNITVTIGTGGTGGSSAAGSDGVDSTLTSGASLTAEGGGGGSQNTTDRKSVV